MTRLFAEADVRRALRPELALAAIEAGFRETSPPAGRYPAPLGEGNAAMVLMPGRLPGIPAYTVKVHAKFPGATPAIRGVVLLHDATDGRLLAILPSPYLTALRTAAAAAIGTQVLARPEAGSIAFIGCGVQASAILRLLRRLRPMGELRACDLDPARAEGFAAKARTLGLDARAAGLAEAVEGAGIVIAATWAREPFLTAGMLAPGAHLTTLGPDQPGKQEADAGLLSAARVVVDDVALQLEMGAVGNAGLTRAAIAATLGEVLTGAAPGRRREDEITVFASLGLPWQDLALAWAAYAAGGGTDFDFGD